MMPVMLRVGLTGNIASGKSEAARVFAELGAHIIDADRIAHESLSPGTATYTSVLSAFGKDLLNSDLSIDRRKLGSLVFKDAEKRTLLNNLVHPGVRKEIWRRMAEIEEETGSNCIVIVDAALLVEYGQYKLYHRLVVVTCDPSLQLARIVTRDGLSLEEAQARISSQMPVQEKLKVADYTIDTSGTFKETRRHIEAVYRDMILVELRMRENPDHLQP